MEFKLLLESVQLIASPSGGVESAAAAAYQPIILRTIRLTIVTMYSSCEQGQLSTVVTDSIICLLFAMTQSIVGILELSDARSTPFAGSLHSAYSFGYSCSRSLSVAARQLPDKNKQTDTASRH